MNLLNKIIAILHLQTVGYRTYIKNKKLIKNQ